MKNDRYYEHFKADDVTWFRMTTPHQLTYRGGYMFSNYFYAGACGYSTLNQILKYSTLDRLQFLRIISKSP